MVLSPLDIYPVVGLVDHWVVLFLVFKEICMQQNFIFWPLVMKHIRNIADLCYHHSVVLEMWEDELSA
jgi:hypothetical protein